MQAVFRECATKSSDEFEDTKHAVTGEDQLQEAACILLYKTVKHCGKSWGRCHSEEEVQHLENMYLESLMSQYKDIKLDHCQVVVDYMQSERGNKINNKPEKCNQELTVQAQQNFQACSQASSTQAYQKIMDVEEEVMVKKILCDTLETIKNDCRVDLETCFSAGDIEIMNESNVKQMKPFLVRIARGKVDEKALEDCQAKDIKPIKDEKYPSRSGDTQIITTPPQKDQKGDNKPSNNIEKEDVKTPNQDTLANVNENNEKLVKPKVIPNVKTTSSPPKAAFKTESASSVSQISNPRVMVFLILFKVFY